MELSTFIKIFSSIMLIVAFSLSVIAFYNKVRWWVKRETRCLSDSLDSEEKESRIEHEGMVGGESKEEESRKRLTPEPSGTIYAKDLEQVLGDLRGDLSPIDQLNERISVLENSVSNLKQLIADNPESVVNVALLKKEFELLEKRVNQIDSNQKWFFGILIALMFGVMALAISILLK